MVKFLTGLVVGAAVCAAVLATLAVLNPRDRDEPPAAVPGQSAQPAGPAPAAEPAPEPEPEPASEPASAPGQQGAATPESEPVTETAAQSAAAPQVGAVPMPGGDVAPPPPAPAVAAADDTAPGSQPQRDAAPAVAMMADGGASAAGEAAPVIPAAPQIGGGMEMSAPAPGGESASLPGTGGDRPIRIAAVPQQVTAGSMDTGARPSVDTESAAMPQIGGSELENSEIAAGPAPALQAGSALADNAAVFAGVGDRPLMSIILIDTGESPELRPGLTALTAPITFGVDAGMGDAGQVAGDYRAAGFEVAAVLPGAGPLGLAEGLEEEDVAPLLARVFDRIPVAATLLGPVDGPLPRDRRMANAVLDALTVTGHGLLTYRGNGLNNVPIIAGEKGVPSALVYRLIDEEPGSANIGLALERAVLDASRSGHVIVVGRVRQETVTTLFSWLLGSGVREVTIAPASAVLRKTGS